jgi:Vanillate O-demethylase oxygenase C-terminal domain
VCDGRAKRAALSAGRVDAPETETATHDFWAVARDFALDDQGVSDFLHDSNRTVVLQDVLALDKLEQVIATEPESYQELSINIDTGWWAGCPGPTVRAGTSGAARSTRARARSSSGRGWSPTRTPTRPEEHQDPGPGPR